MRPAEHEQSHEERDQRKAQRKDREPEQELREQARAADADQRAQHADRQLADDVFGQRSGATNRLPRLRAYNSSMNVSDTPSWPRNSTSHSNTAPMKKPGASFRKLFVGAR